MSDETRTEPPRTGSRKNTNSLGSVLVLNIFVSILTAVLVAGGLIYVVLEQPDVVEKLRPVSELLHSVTTDSADKDITRVTLEEDSAVIDAVADASSAVVSIVGTQKVRSFFYNQIYENDFAGTGFIIDKEQGLILTNRHVVDEEAEYQLVTNQGVEVSFTTDDIFIDPSNDLAIVKVEFPSDIEISEIILGDSDSLVPGQRVIAIGNALGKFANTVTTGVVSALGRQVEAGSMFGTNQEVLLDVIQTDAAINQGNSGGPLLNLLGQAVGVNTAIAGSAENIGFAIPIDDAKVAIESFLLHGEILRPWLGVSYVQLTPDIAELNNFYIDSGAYVRDVVANSPADKVGIKEGDIISQVDGQELDQDNGLLRVMQKYQVDDVVDVVILRPDDPDSLETDYEEITLTVTLEARQLSSSR